MRSLLAAVVLTLFLSPVAFAGGGDFNDMPQQQGVSPTNVVVVTPLSDNTGIYVTAVATVVATLGAAYIGVLRRKKK